ncbi:MAG: hypothetical protein U0800_27695 [Isosphaeraceae bacterium]
MEDETPTMPMIRGMFLWVILPVALFAATLSIVCASQRNLTCDKLSLLGLFAIANAVYVRHWRIIAAALVVASIAAYMDLAAFADGWLSEPLRKYAMSRLPDPRNFHMPDYIDAYDELKIQRKMDQEVALGRFVVVGVLVLILEFAGIWSMRSKRIPVVFRSCLWAPDQQASETKDDGRGSGSPPTSLT